MPYENWLAAQGLVELQQSPLKDQNEEDNDSMVAKQIDSIHMTLDVIYNFIQDNTIGTTDRENLLSKLNAICKCLEQQGDIENKKRNIKEIVTHYTKGATNKVEKKDGDATEGGRKGKGFIKDEQKYAIEQVEKKDGDATEGGRKGKEFVKDEQKDAIDQVEKKDGDATKGDEFSVGMEDNKEKEEVVTEILPALDESLESVKSHEMEEDTGTAARTEGVSKTDGGKECLTNVADQQG